MASHEANKIDFIEFPATSVAALEKSRKFFADAFGWSHTQWGDDYADLGDSGLGAGINADPEHRAALPLVIVYACDLETSRTKVVAAGGVITKDIFSFPNGRRFHFREPGGNELAVWSDR